MVKEYKFIMENDVVLRPKGKYVVYSMWIYKIMHAVDGNIEKYKARFVVSLKRE